MSTERFHEWLPAVLIAIIAAGILATGIGFTARSLYLINPPAAIRTASLPVSAPTPHDHCTSDVGIQVPLHRMNVIRPKDYGSFGLALQEYAYRMGGCSRYFDRRHYRLQLPQPAIDQILTLDRRTYADWAASATRTSTVGTVAEPLRYIDLYFIYRQDRNGWMLSVGIPLIILGILAGVFALMVGSVTYDEGRQQTGPATQTAPSTAGSHPRSS